MEDLSEAFNEAFAGQEEDLIIFLNDCDSSKLTSFVKENPIAFFDLCQAGFLRAAQCLIDFGADVSAQCFGVTPLQNAASSGDLQLVKFLLKNRAKISREVWMDDSPFHSASLNGHFEVITELTTAYPSLVKDPESRSSLFYAACKGGNLDIVRFWYLPGMDINSPVQLISSFENCENMVPLYAACEGNQLEVAEFLLENGAVLTANVCLHFPEICGKLVERCFQQTSNEMYAAKLSNCHLGYVPDMWFEKYVTHLTVVDLSDNKLKSLPSVIPWGLPNLQFLNLSRNKLQVFDGPNQDQGLCEELEVVDLSENLLEDVCPELFCLPSLTILNVSTNNLQHLLRPDHFQPELTWAGQSRERKVSSGNTDCEWNLPSLTHLHAHQNKLVLVPEELRTCEKLRYADFSDNELYSFISPWNCPLSNLNLSDNMLERFPVSVEEFWSGTMINLSLQNNSLEEVGESIVKLSELQTLNLSNNKIERLPEPSVWDCRYLESLNLSNNNLGVPLTEGEVNKMALLSPKTMKNFLSNRRRKDSEGEKNKNICFPTLLAMSLKYLYLRNNNLDTVPKSVCRLYSLSQLDISQNPLITRLPQELGLLTQCQELVLSGTNIKDIPERLLLDSKTFELLEYLRQLLRKCEPNTNMKMIVLGPQDKGKTSLIGHLLGSAGQGYHHGNNIYSTKWKLSARSAYNLLLPSSKPDIQFNIWELPGHPDLNIIHQCFLTRNTLYLLVFDLRKDFLHLQDWLSLIQANAPNAFVILVGTFHDKLDPSSREMYLNELGFNIFRTFGNRKVYGSFPNIRCVKPVSCATKDGIQELKKLIYDTAVEMKNVHQNVEMFIGMKIPRSYRLLAEKVLQKRKELEKENKPPIMSEEEFYSLMQEVPDNEIIALDDVQNALQYLLETGSLLHFNEQLQGLNCIYFLDAVYLQDLMSLIAFIDKGKAVSSAKIPISSLQESFKEKSFPGYLFNQFRQLLSRFEIAVEMDNDRSLLVPSKLPKEKPMISSEISKKEQSQKIYRLYKLPYIPPGLWNRFIIRLIKATERFTQTPWYLHTSIPDQRRSANIERQSSSRGFAIKNRDITYWREGIRVAYNSGYFLVESVNYHQWESEDLGIGILITIVSSDNLGLSAMGVIVDELDDILRDYFPGFQDFVDELPKLYAVCPQCTDPVQDESGIVVSVDHFDVQTCALTILNKGSVPCPKGGKVPLEDLVPEMLFKELPKRFFLDPTKMIISDKSLGTGAAGSVFPGKFGDIDVAIKMFHCTISRPSAGDSVDSGSASMSTQGSQDTGYGNMTKSSSHIDEANSLKAYKAFSEVRKEVAVLSKLRHPCIISFLGLSVQPHLYIAMELAKLGSLRCVLEQETEDRKFNKFTDQHKTYKTVFSRDLTFKIIYQVARGMEYLHENSIIYRDLKSDNVLVCSLDVSVPVNVKLSDYGISKFSTTQGLSGFVGTPGYMAPEILNRQTYNQSVDIFSFSMLIYEVLCGHQPYEEYINLMQIIQAAVKERKRPSIKDFHIVSHYPYLEYLMSVCWEHDAYKRPIAPRITKYMKQYQFVCQHEVLTVPQGGAGFFDVTSISVITEMDWGSSKRHQLWMWESETENRERCYSIYNLDTATFHVIRKPCPGAKVRCMLRVGKFMWVGTEGMEIEVYGCHSVGVPQCKEALTLTATPTDMVFLKLSDNEEEQLGHVFVGLDNGTVSIFSHKPNMRRVNKSWQLVKTLTFFDMPVTSLTLVCDNTELWLGCGHMVIIVCTQELLKEDSINIKNNKMVAQKIKNHRLQQLVSDSGKVWCSFSNSSKIVELDAETREVTYCFDVRGDKFRCKSFKENDEDDSDLEDDTDDDDGEDDVMVRNISCRPAPVMPPRRDRRFSLEQNKTGSYITPLPDPTVTVDESGTYEEFYTEPSLGEPESSKMSKEYTPLYTRVDERSSTFYVEPDEQNISESNEKSSDLYESVDLGKPASKGVSGPLAPPRPSKNKNKKMLPSVRLSTPPPVPTRIGSSSICGPTDLGVLQNSPPPLPPRPKSITVNVPSGGLEKKKLVGGKTQEYETTKSTNDKANAEQPPPLPPRSSALHTSSFSVSGKSSLVSTLEEPPPMLPPRKISRQERVKSTQPKTPEPNDPPLQLRKPPERPKTTKVSSMLLVEDTLWIGTNKGKIFVVGVQGKQKSYPRPQLAMMESVSGVRLDKCPSRTGPLYLMARAGKLVVTSCRVSEDFETELTAWQAVGSERLSAIGQFWRSLKTEEAKLAKKNSLGVTL